MYISIPFCPSRCSYCSFTSHAIEKAAKLIPQYVDLLCEELRDTAMLMDELGLGGREVGAMLARLLDAVLDDPALNDRSTLLSLARATKKP
jgi:hypothetical protein